MKFIKSFHFVFLLILSILVLFASFATHEDPTGFFPRLAEPSPNPGKLQDILKKSETKLSKDPNHLESLVNSGVAHFYLGTDHVALSLNALNRAWQAGALDKRIFYYSGILYENLSLFDESKKQYERFLRHEPRDREIRLRLSRLLYRMEKWDECVASYRAFLQDNQNDLTSLVNAGLALRKKSEILAGKKNRTSEEQSLILSDRNQSLSYLERALQLDGDLPEEVPISLAQIYMDLGQWQKAADLAKKSLEKSPKNRKEFLSLSALSWENLENWPEAIQSYTQLSEIVPQQFSYKRKIAQLKKRIKTTSLKK
ncbi:MAG: tetratricopeptide repeat protein [Elusimicrobia bacterium]|nr:tetratricopeptide repeat protein [Elusimicrobiota bacterium]